MDIDRRVASFDQLPLNYREGKYGFLREEACPGSVVLSDPNTSYHINGPAALATPTTCDIIPAIDGHQ